MVFRSSLVLVLKTARIAVLAVVGSLVLAACGGQASNGQTAASANEKIRVVTTMSVLSDMIRHVGGERVQVENIIPVGAGPEDFQPSPRDAQAIAQADIVFYNGLGLEEWLEPLFQSAGKPDQPRVAVSEGLTPLDVGDEEFAAGNPHFWMSAANGVRYVENIRAALAKVDPAGASTYDTNAKRYTTELNLLNAELKQQAAAIPEANRKLVTNHDAFPYFAQEYGFTMVGSILGNPEASPSAGDLAKLVEAIKRENVKAIFTEAQFSDKQTNALISDAGIQVVANLYTDTLGDSNSGVTSYVEMLRYDMKTVVEALK